MQQPTLPNGITLRSFAGDLVITGADLNQERYQELVSALPANVREHVIGWKRTAR